MFFVEKNVRSFCSAKASLIFSIKNISVFGYKVEKHLLSWILKLVKANDALNNMPLECWVLITYIVIHSVKREFFLFQNNPKNLGRAA